MTYDKRLSRTYLKNSSDIVMILTGEESKCIAWLDSPGKIAML